MAHEEGGPGSPPSLNAVSDFGIATSLGDFWRGHIDAAPQSFDLKVQVNYYDPDWGNLWCRVGNVDGYLPAPRGLPLKRGQVARLRGVALPSNQIAKDGFEISEVAEDPNPPKPIIADDILPNYRQLTAKLVRLRAIVDSVDTPDRHHLQITASAAGRRLNIYVLHPDPESVTLVKGEILEVEGVYNAIHQSLSDRFEVDLWVSGAEHVKVVGDLGSETSFAAATPVRIEELPQAFTADVRRVKVLGVVELNSSAHGIRLRDGTGEVIVRSSQSLSAQVGDVVEAVGRPDTGSADWQLADAVVRTASPALTKELKERVANTDAIRLAAQVVTARNPEQQIGKPVTLTGVIMGVPSMKKMAFLHDTSGTVKLDTSLLVPGQIKNRIQVRIRGTVQPGGFVNQVRVEETAFLAPCVPPFPVRVSYDEAVAGGLYGSRVEVSGLVRKATTEKEAVVLEVLSEGGPLTVFAPLRLRSLALEGSLVTLNGVCHTVADTQGRPQRLEVYVSDAGDLAIDAGPAIALDEVPEVAIGDLYRARVRVRGPSWSRTLGTVTARLSERVLVVQDGGSAIEIETKAPASARVGDRVSVVGFFTSLRGLERLVDSSVDVLSSTAETQPLVLEGQERVEKVARNLLVRGRGRVAQREGDQVTIFIETSRGETPVLLDWLPEASRASRLPGVDAEVEVTGILSPLVGDAVRAGVNRILMRDPSDLVIVKAGPWWTARRLAIALGGLACVSLLGLAWSVSLRRQVARQTERIRSQAEKEASLKAAHEVEIAENSTRFRTVLAERTRFARELHDTLGQTLVGITMQINAVLRVWDVEPGENRERLQTVSTLIRQCEAELRQAIWDLRARELEAFDLSTALAQSMNRILSPAGFETQAVTVGESRPLPHSLEENFVRIAQEAMNNIVRHARARRVLVTLAFSPESLKMTIADDGVGFAAETDAAPRGRHFGLIGMRERAKRIGASFSITPRSEGGTCVTVEAALPSEAKGTECPV